MLTFSKSGTMPWSHNFLKGSLIYTKFISPTNAFMIRAASMLKDRSIRGSPHPERRDMLARFTEAQKAHPDVVDDNVLRTYVVTNLLAGSDTTAIVLRSAVYFAIKNPHAYQRLQQELDDNNITYPIPYKVAAALPYVDAFITEVLRIHPVIGLPQERIVPPEGMDTPFGHRLPGGSIIFATPWVTHFNEEVFGPDAESFNPDRWLRKEKESDEAYKERLANMRYNDFSFSKGPRKCLGIHVAQQELWKTIPTLLGLFDVSGTAS
jgi:cytochrome P450